MMIRQAMVADAEAAALVLRRSITELCGRDHAHDPALLASWLANKTAAKFRDWAEAEDYLCLVAADGDGAILGVGLMSTAGEIRLNYVSPDARFKGVSTALIGALQAAAMKRASRNSPSTAPPPPTASIWRVASRMSGSPRPGTSRTISIR